MDAALRPEGAAVDAALCAWCRQATDVLTAATAALYLPTIVVITFGYGPSMGSVVRAFYFTAYLVIAATALLRRVAPRTRLWAFFIAAYLVVAIANLTVPRGPFAQVGLVVHPILVLVLCGAPAARFAVLVSATILVSAPFLRGLPSVARTLAIDPAQVAGPPSLIWFQSAVVMAYLMGLMVLLDRFHRLLLDALVAQCRAKAELEREAVERSAAQRKMEDEMRERRRLEREIADIGDGERRRLGQELHDGVCQQVTAAMLRCQALERRVERGGAVSGADFATLSTLLADSIDEAHKVALGLCPLEPDAEALVAALRALAMRTQEIAGVRCEFLVADDVGVPDPAMAQHLYRIAQEALSNAVRHAHASWIAIELRGSADELLLQVEDDGVGLPAELPAGGMGLRTMAYRAHVMEGELTVASAPSGGVRVTCRVPRLAGGPPATRHHSRDQQWIPTT